MTVTGSRCTLSTTFGNGHLPGQTLKLPSGGAIAINLRIRPLINPTGSNPINGEGCGNGVSSDGNYITHLITMAHDQIEIQSWTRHPWIRSG